VDVNAAFLECFITDQIPLEFSVGFYAFNVEFI